MAPTYDAASPAAAAIRMALSRSLPAALSLNAKLLPRCLLVLDYAQGLIVNQPETPAQSSITIGNDSRAHPPRSTPTQCPPKPSRPPATASSPASWSGSCMPILYVLAVLVIATPIIDTRAISFASFCPNSGQPRLCAHRMATEGGHPGRRGMRRNHLLLAHIFITFSPAHPLSFRTRPAARAFHPYLRSHPHGSTTKSRSRYSPKATGAETIAQVIANLGFAAAVRLPSRLCPFIEVLWPEPDYVDSSWVVCGSSLCPPSPRRPPTPSPPRSARPSADAHPPHHPPPRRTRNRRRNQPSRHACGHRRRCRSSPPSAHLVNAPSLRNPLSPSLPESAASSSISLLGATLERRGWIGNDLVNFSSTAFAADPLPARHPLRPSPALLQLTSHQLQLTTEN